MEKKNFYLLSFLPALVYWYLEENYPVRVAVSGGLILAVLEIAIEYYFTKHIHTLSKFNFFLILGLGGISLLGDEGIWFKLQPMFTGVGIAGFLFYRLFIVKKGLLLEMSEVVKSKQNVVVPSFLMNRMERDLAGLFFVYGLFMGGIALKGSTDLWLFFKTLGFYLTFAIFVIIEMLLMRRSLRVLAEIPVRGENRE